MKLIHFSDTHLGFNDLDTLNHAGNRWCISKPLTYATHFYLITIILEVFYTIKNSIGRYF